MIENSIKKEIIEKWAAKFESLTVYSQNKLYKTCGPFVFGIELLSLPRTEDYRPVFVCYPLWKPGVKECLDEPFFIEEIRNKKGLQINIPYRERINYFEEAVECAQKQASILRFSNVTLEQLFETIDKQFLQGIVRASPVAQLKLFEAKFFGALYLNEMNKCAEIVDDLNKLIDKYEPKLLEWKYGDLNIWLGSLQKQTTNQEGFFNQIEKNKEDKEISKLTISGLIL